MSFAVLVGCGWFLVLCVGLLLALGFFVGVFWGLGFFFDLSGGC